jgi:hypothetical protein
MPTSLAASRTPLPLIAGFALFLVTIGYAVAASFARPSVTIFEPSPIKTPVANGDPGVGGPITHDAVTGSEPTTAVITIDATDDVTWRYLDLDRGTVVIPPDTAGWDVGFRRHTIIVAAGAVDAGEVPWDSVTRAPAGAYPVASRGADAGHPAMRRWYRYRMLTHVLEPKHNVYVIRTAAGEYAKLQILSYYCPGPRAGCPTVRYTLPIAGPR